MTNNIQDKKYSKKYNISDYTQRIAINTKNNQYNIVYLLNPYFHKVSILNVKIFKEQCDSLETWKQGNFTNINRLKKLCSDAMANPPLKTKGIAIANQKLQELINLLDERKKILDQINTSSMITKAKQIREQNISDTIEKLENYIREEEKDKEINLADSKLKYYDYFPIVGDV